MIRAIRHYSGLTQEQFAEIIGFSTTALSFVETGARPISYRMRSAIVKHFPLDEGFFLFLADYRKINELVNDIIIAHE